MDGNCHTIATGGSYSASNLTGGIVGGVLGTLGLVVGCFFCCRAAVRRDHSCDSCACCPRKRAPPEPSQGSWVPGPAIYPGPAQLGGQPAGQYMGMPVVYAQPVYVPTSQGGDMYGQTNWPSTTKVTTG